MKSARYVISYLFASLVLIGPSLCHAKAALRKTPEDHSELLETVHALLERVASLEANQNDLLENQTELINRISSLEQDRDELAAQIQDSTRQHERRLQDSCIAEDSKAAGGLVIRGCNVFVQNGAGSTATANSLGNLIVGYNEIQDQKEVRSGSHNLVLGIGNSYRSYTGIVTGRSNALNAAYASITGGHNNAVDADFGSILAGEGNVVRGLEASISGGSYNNAVGGESSILGGKNNNPSGFGSTVVGGTNNNPANQYEVAGGNQP